MKALLIHKFKNIPVCVKTIPVPVLWIRNANCFTIFVHRNLGEKSIQSCEYHVVQRPCK